MNKVRPVVGACRNVAARKRFGSLNLLAVFCIAEAATGGVAAPTACEDRPAVKGLIRQAGDSAGRYEERRAAFEKALRHCPNVPQFYSAFSVLLLKHGAVSSALDWIGRGLRIAPSSTELRFSQGVALLTAGRGAEALQVLQQLPADANTEFYIGMAHRQLGAHDAARKALLRAFESGYPDPYVLYVVIEQDRALGDKKAGLEHFQIFDRRFPQSPFLHLLLGDAYLAQNQDTEAEREYREALKQNSSLPVVHSKLGFLEFTRAHYAEAAEFFRQEIALNPDFAESHLYLGLSLRSLGKNGEAIPAFEQAIARNPSSLNAYRQLATAMSQEGRLEEALEVLQKGVKRFPDDETLHAQLARLLTRLGRVSEGERAAEQARQLMEKNAKPSAVPAQGAESKVGEVLTNAEQMPPALEQARRCLERADAACADAALTEIRDEQLRRSAVFLALEAESLELKQKYADGLAAIKKAIEADPHQPRYLITQGELYQKVGDQVSAIRSFIEAEKLGDRSPAPVYSIGMSFFVLGYHDDLKEYYERASRHFRLALQLDPQFSKAEFMLGVIGAVGSALPEARRHLEKAVQLNPDNAYYRVHYGVLLSRLGDDAGALEQLQDANRLMASYAPAHFNLGKIYARLGRYTEARVELETAVRINPNFAAAFYTLGSVYRHLGSDDMSRQAFESFNITKQHSTDIDPLDAAISATESTTGGQNP